MTAAPILDFVLPRTSALQRVDGVLTGPDGGLAGASVTAVDAQGSAVSAPSVSEADGGYTLYLPPSSPPPVAVQIGPQTDADAGVAAAALDPFPTYPPVAYAAVAAARRRCRPWRRWRRAGPRRRPGSSVRRASRSSRSEGWRRSCW